MGKKRAGLLALAGSIMAFHVGSGFASGQEILQFYTAFGPIGGGCMCVLAAVLLTLFSAIVMETGRRCRGRSLRESYVILAGKAVGTAFYAVTPLFMALVLCVTVAGGGAALRELFGVSVGWGRLWISLPVLITVLLGLKWITALSGSLGPVIILCAFSLGGFGILQGRATSLWALLPHTCSSWVLAAVSYACFGTVTQIPFLLTVGAELKSRRETHFVAFTGNCGYMLTGFVLHLGLCRSLPDVLGEPLPTLILARRLSSLCGWFYGMILLFSIYTTAVPMLWSVCRSIAPQEHSALYRCAAVLLTAIACVGSCLPFERLLGLLYPYIGYASAVFFAVILLRRGFSKKCCGFCSESLAKSGAGEYSISCCQ